MRMGIRAAALGAALVCSAAVAEPASAFTFKPYGFIKADVAVDHGNPNAPAGSGFGGNYVRWVDPRPQDVPTTWSIHARQSRLGLEVVGDKVGQTEVLGRVEVDFTNASAEYTYALKLRRAYLELSTPTLQLLAGQEADIFSPLVPDTINYLVGWWAGDIGFRRPQLRLTHKHALGADRGIDLVVGIERSIPGPQTDNPTPENLDVALPVLAARVGYRAPAVQLGVSGHYAHERERFATGTPQAWDKVFASWSGNLDLGLTFSKRVVFSGELFYGENLDSYFGGIGQGVLVPQDEVDPVGLRTLGGWGMLGLLLDDKLKVNGGATIELPEESDLPLGGRTRNMSIFANVQYMMAQDLWVALEGSYFSTGYKVAEGADDLDSDDERGQLAFIYRFK